MYPPRRPKDPPAVCAFCDEKVPRPKKIEMSSTFSYVKGGFCSCGALFLLDEKGKHGGETLLEALTLLCEGDSDRAIHLEEKVDYRLRRRGYDPRAHTLIHRVKGMGGYGQPKLWFLKLKTK